MVKLVTNDGCSMFVNHQKVKAERDVWDIFAQKSSKYHPLEFLLRIHGNYSKMKYTKYIIKTTIAVSVTMTLPHPPFTSIFKEVPASLFFSFPFQIIARCTISNKTCVYSRTTFPKGGGEGGCNPLDPARYELWM